VRELVIPSGAVVGWDGTDERGREVPSGVYFMRTDGGGRDLSSRKVIVIR